LQLGAGDRPTLRIQKGTIAANAMTAIELRTSDFARVAVLYVVTAPVLEGISVDFPTEIPAKTTTQLSLASWSTTVRAPIVMKDFLPPNAKVSMEYSVLYRLADRPERESIKIATQASPVFNLTIPQCGDIVLHSRATFL
jgi:hypothetical protein